MASGAVAITAQRQRIVLATLLLNANQVVPLDRLIRAVWDGSPPTTARAQIQTAVSALRRSLAAAGLGRCIQTRGLGYTIELAPGQLDQHVFVDRVARGRAARAEQDLETARAAYREALDLWRGEPLDGLDSSVIRAVAIRMEEQRIETLEECIEVELELGLHHRVIGELKALADEHPLRERLASQLITALHRSGRPAEALAAYRAVRQSFIRELGLEPSASLRRLERAILNGDAGTEESPAIPPQQAAVARAVPRMLPPRVRDFTGRTDEAEALKRLLKEGTSAEGCKDTQVAVIVGHAGVGKSALAAQVAHEVVPHFPDGHLYATVVPGHGGDDGMSTVLERLLDALGHPVPSLPHRLVDRLALYRSALAERRVLIVVEDITDEAQLQMLEPSTPGSFVLATSRVRPTTLAGRRTYEIGPLSLAEGLALLTKVVGHERIAAEPSEALELVELCGRRPLDVSAAAARLAARPHWMLADVTSRLRDEGQRLEGLIHLGAGLLPPQRSVFAGLSSSQRLLLERLAVIETDDFAGWVAGPLLDLKADAAIDVLEALVDARMVDVVDGVGAATRYRLDDLARIYARGVLAPQMPLPKVVAAQERLLGAWLFLSDEVLRRQGRVPEAQRATAPRWPLPESVVNSVLEDPASWYETERMNLLSLVQQKVHTGSSKYCWNLALAVGALAEVFGCVDDWRQSHDDALAIVRADDDRLGEAALLYSQGALSLRRHRPARAEVELNLALGVFERLGETEWCELVRLALAQVERTRRAPTPVAEHPVPFRHGANVEPESRFARPWVRPPLTSLKVHNTAECASGNCSAPSPKAAQPSAKLIALPRAAVGGQGID